MSSFKKGNPADFASPIALPGSDDQRQGWQKANRTWWEEHPMRYDFTRELGLEEFSREYYVEIDRRFFSNVGEFMPYERIPFDPLIDFEALAERDVLEIGVGCGSHAQLLATHARSFTGIDLTDYAVHSTSQRMRCFDLDATILRLDAERMSFADESFDFIWSWGVIHHSSDTPSILREMHRVLRPGGRACVMIYHRSFWIYYVMAGFFRGVLMGELFKTGSLNKTLQRWTDGAIARYYTVPEWKELTEELFDIESIRIFGQKNELFPLPPSRLKDLAVGVVPDSLTRFVTNSCRQGKFLYAEMVKRA
jgi:ubiquinone/menaquinone biosynthesis C-methylase UbiE